MLKWAYTTSKAGDFKCEEDKFYLQEVHINRITEPVLRFLHRNKPKVFTVPQISKGAKVKRRDINGVIPYNLSAGNINRYLLERLEPVGYGYIIPESYLILLQSRKII